MKVFLKKTFIIVTLLHIYMYSIAQSDFESKIQENKYYDCFITKIVKVNNGYLLKCLVEVAPNNAEIAWVVVPSTNMYYRGKHISPKTMIYNKGKIISLYRTYSLSFKKYNQKPLGRKREEVTIGDDYGEIADILLGYKVVSLQETFNIRTYYTTLDFGIKKQNFDSLALKKETWFSESIDSLQKIVHSFLYDFSYNDLTKTTCSSCDTSQINACFSKWGESNYIRFLGPIEFPSKRKRRYDWDENKNFSQRIKICQEMYGLPFIGADPNMYNVTILNMQLLYSNDNLLTIRVQWAIHQHSVYSIVLSLRQTSGNWDIVGIARKLLNE